MLKPAIRVVAISLIGLYLGGCAHMKILSLRKDAPLDRPIKEFRLTAQRFYFQPREVIVNQGDIVRLTIVSNDVTHGFVIPQIGINEKLEFNKPTTVEFYAQEKGIAKFRCSIFCGLGHFKMRGKIIVK